MPQKSRKYVTYTFTPTTECLSLPYSSNFHPHENLIKQNAFFFRNVKSF